MKLRVVVNNQTSYRTRDLQRFCRAGLKAMGIDSIRVVNFKPIRKHDGADVTGLGEYGERIKGVFHEGVYIRMRLPKIDKLDLAHVARVFEHEVLHTLGVSHRRMTYKQRTCTGQSPSWMKNLKLRVL